MFDNMYFRSSFGNPWTLTKALFSSSLHWGAKLIIDTYNRYKDEAHEQEKTAWDRDCAEQWSHQQLLVKRHPGQHFVTDRVAFCAEVKIPRRVEEWKKVVLKREKKQNKTKQGDGEAEKANANIMDRDRKKNKWAKEVERPAENRRTRTEEEEMTKEGAEERMRRSRGKKKT